MTTELPLDRDRLRTWIGRMDEAVESVTAALAERFRATFDLLAAAGDVSAPPGLHWCLSPLLAPTAALGMDGHPERGGFLPPVPLPRRMWAGGELLLLRPLRVGDAVRRTSTIEDVTVKQGRSGTLCFVTVRHDLLVDNETAIRERQDIVYRAVGGPEPSPMKSTAEEIAQWHRSVPASTVLLFRYSALTFNGHRIHYDRRYCEEQENYPGLVVHGPLQATLLLQLATEARGVQPARFTFRGVAPFFDTAGPISAMARQNGSGLHLWTAGPSGAPCMVAEAHWG